MVVNGGSLYGGGVRQRRRRQPRPDLLHQRRRQRHDLPLRGLAQRRQLPGSDLPRHPGLQADRRRGEAGHARQPVGGAGLRRSPVGLRRPDRQRPKRPGPGRERRSSPRSSSSSPTRPARAAGRPRARKSPATTSSTTPSAPAPAGCRPGSTKGAPDALLLGGPPDPDPEDPTNPPLYDYSNDFYLEPTPDTDKGVQIRRDDTSGCHYVPTGTTNPESQVHRWVTDPMAADFKMTGNVTLEFYTRTLNDALYTGTLCVYLFKRHETGTPPVATDTMLTNEVRRARPTGPTPRRGTGYWPRNAWTKVRLTMTFNGAPYTIPAGDRLGVALSVERGEHPAPTRSRSCTTTPTTRPGSRSTPTRRSTGARGAPPPWRRLPRRADRRQLRHRRRPPGAARGVDRRAALALPRLRGADRRLRQRPGPLLAGCCAAGPAAAGRRSRRATR